jgi:hypothetical protein
MTSVDSHADKTPEQLEREINQTRDHVDETVRALVDRLSPGQLVDQGLEYVRHSDAAAGARTFATNLGRAVRDNPVPAAMITAGFIWLATSRGSRRSGDWEPYDTRADGERSLRDSLTEWTESTGDRLAGFAEHAGDQAAELKDRATERASELKERASESMIRARRTWHSLLDEQPLVLGLAGVVIGALIGAALPPTESEDRLMGEARDAALAKASEAVDLRT